MKFNVVCISMAIGLLASSIQAAPVVNTVEKVVQDTVSSADGVKAPLDGTNAFAQKLATDVGDAAHLTKRQELLNELPVVNDLAGALTGALKKRQDVGGLVNGITGSVEGLIGSPLGKRLLDNQGDGSTGASGNDLVGSLLGKRDGLGGTVKGLTNELGLQSTVDGVLEEAALKKRDGVDGTLKGLTGSVDGLATDLGLRRRDGLAGGLTEPVTGTVSGLNLDQTVGGLTDVNKLVSDLPVDTSSVAGLAGLKRAHKSDKPNGDDEKTKDDAEKAKDGAKKVKDADKTKDETETTDDDDNKPKDDADKPKDDADKPQEAAAPAETD